MFFIVKLLLSAAIIALVSELGKRLPTFAALIASLPLVSILAMCWMYREGVSNANLARHAEATFWYVLPSLPMFLLLPYLLRHGQSFVFSMLAGCLLTVVLYIVARFLAHQFGVDL